MVESFCERKNKSALVGYTKKEGANQENRSSREAVLFPFLYIERLIAGTVTSSQALLIIWRDQNEQLQ